MTTGATFKMCKFYCDNCGADLSDVGSVIPISHTDFAGFYEETFECSKCGQKIIQRELREEPWGGG